MTRFLRYALFACAACVLTAGCVESSREEATGKSAFRGVNAIADSPDVGFLIEERSIGSIAFRGASAVQRYDDLSYNFNFDLTVPGESERRRLATEFIDVTADRSYVLVLTGSIANPEIVSWFDEEREWDGSETVFELGFAHFNDAIGEVDVYVAAPGTMPVAGNQVATLARGERQPPLEFAEGEYVIMLTPAGDPGTVLYTSAAITYSPATTDTLMIFNDDPARTGEIGVRIVSETGTATELPDPRFPPTGRFLHAALGAGNVDIAENGDFANLIVANQAFGELSGDLALTPGANDYTWTAAGNQGAVLLASDQTVSSGLRSTYTLVGPVADPGVLSQISNRRPFATSARIGFSHVASNFETLDLYLLRDDATVDDSNPSSPAIPFQFSTGTGSLEAGSYTITVTAADDKTPLAGPVDIDLANRDVYSIFILDTADPNAVEIRILQNAP